MDCPPRLKELLEVIYSLSGAETEVLVELCRNSHRASTLAEELGKDRTTVQRYLSKLRAAGLVERTSVNEEGVRGRYYVYSVPDKEELKEEIRKRLDAWEKERLEVLDDI